jgi:hypothetical protein
VKTFTLVGSSLEGDVLPLEFLLLSRLKGVQINVNNAFELTVM